MIYITGDKHGDFSEVYAFCCKNKTTRDDLMIVLGDAGINYYANEQDIYLKNSLLQYPMTFFCIRDNCLFELNVCNFVSSIFTSF